MTTPSKMINYRSEALRQLARSETDFGIGQQAGRIQVALVYAVLHLADVIGGKYERGES